MKYGFEGMFKNEMTGLIIPGDATTNFREVTGDQAISQLGFGSDNLPVIACAMILLGMVLFLITLAFASLQSIANRAKKSVQIKKASKNQNDVAIPIPDTKNAVAPKS